MAKNTLTQTAQILRKVVIATGVIMVVVFGVNFFVQLITTVQNPFTRDGSYWTLADERFGVLPKPQISSLEIGPESQPTFVVEGNLPQGIDAPDTALVYRLTPPLISLNTIDNAVATAQSLGFISSYKEESTEQNGLKFSWKNAAGTRSLSYEIITGKLEVWKMRTEYFFDAVAQLPKSITKDPDYYANRGSSILSTIKLSVPTLTSGIQEATLGKLGIDGLFSEPITASGADYVDIQLFHQLLLSQVVPGAANLVEEGAPEPEDISAKVFKTDPRKGSMSMVVSNDVNDTTKDVFTLDFTKFSYSETDTSTYNIISPEEAWERIRLGEGSLTLLQKQPIDRFSRNRVLSVRRFIAEGSSTELGYFEPDVWQEFITPIYVFKGRVETTDGDSGRFVFYVDALERF